MAYKLRLCFIIFYALVINSLYQVRHKSKRISLVNNNNSK